jgi:hypothetical protein
MSFDRLARLFLLPSMVQAEQTSWLKLETMVIYVAGMYEVWTLFT